MSAVGADPRAYRLVMHTQPNLTAAHALLCKSQRLCHARLIGLPGLWLRGKVQLAPTTAEALAPRPILPALEDLCCLPTLGASRKNAPPRTRHRCARLHCYITPSLKCPLSVQISRARLSRVQLRSFPGVTSRLQRSRQTLLGRQRVRCSQNMETGV